MPRPRTPRPEEKAVSIEQLVTETRGSLNFSPDEIIQMMSKCLDKPKKEDRDLLITHRDIRYRIPIGNIEKYFLDHPRPTRKMSVKEENEYLKKKLAEAEGKIETLKPQEVKIVKPKQDGPTSVFETSPLAPMPESDDEPEPDAIEPAGLESIMTGEIEKKRKAPAAKKGKPKTKK